MAARSSSSLLRLRYVAERLDAVLSEAARTEPTYLDFLDNVLRQEVAAKQRTRIAMGLKIAHFPTVKTLDAFDFKFQPSVDQRLVRELATGRFLAQAENVLIFGAPGAAFEGNREDALRLLEMLGMYAGNQPEEGMNGGQTDIASRGPVAPWLLTVVQKGDDDVGRQGIEIQLGHRPTGVCGGEPQQEGEAVSIAADGVRTGAADLGKGARQKTGGARTRAS
jgi:hypothetical protein